MPFLILSSISAVIQLIIAFLLRDLSLRAEEELLMRNVKSDPAGRDVHLWSPAPVSGASRLPQNLGTGQSEADHSTILGSVGSHKTVRKMIGKLGREPRRVWLTAIRRNPLQNPQARLGGDEKGPIRVWTGESPYHSMLCSWGQA